MFLRLCIGIGAFLFSSVVFSENLVTERIEFAIVIPSYNNEKWCIGNITSCFAQTYPYFKVYYINDCSKDHTGELVERYVTSRGLKDKCIIINNTERRGALANLDSTIRMIDPKKVVVTVDGDDLLANSHVLEKLAAIYSSGEKIWLTYGNYKTVPYVYQWCCSPIPLKIQQKNEFRKYPWVTSHLRTFYAGLFQRIQKKDLLYQGHFFPMTWDLAMMFPMLEMASRGHIRFIPEVLYLYNVSNPINDFKVNSTLQSILDSYIRALPPYTPLETLF